MAMDPVRYNHIQAKMPEKSPYFAGVLARGQLKKDDENGCHSRSFNASEILL
jgi:hypothetical protein